MPEKEERSKKNPDENFIEMFESFGRALSEIFNDPKLKEKAKELGKSAAASAEAFGNRFRDEEVKAKFRETGKAAQEFGRSIADYFTPERKEDKKK